LASGEPSAGGAGPKGVVLLLPDSPEECRRIGQTYKEWGEWLIERAAAGEARAEGAAGARDAFSGPALPRNLTIFLRRTTLKARWLLRQIAQDNIHHGRAEARLIRQRADQAHPGRLGGWVRSIAAASKRLGWPKPYEEEHEALPDGGGRQTIYRMEPAVARAIIDLLDEEGVLRIGHPHAGAS
jgi:hypothetical protein